MRQPRQNTQRALAAYSASPPSRSRNCRIDHTLKRRSHATRRIGCVDKYGWLQRRGVKTLVFCVPCCLISVMPPQPTRSARCFGRTLPGVDGNYPIRLAVPSSAHSRILPPCWAHKGHTLHSMPRLVLVLRRVYSFFSGGCWRFLSGGR